MATLLSSSVLIVSDDPEFARTLTARWQAERHVPEITIATGSVWHPASAPQHDLVILGPLRDSNSRTILFTLNSFLHATICFAEEKSAVPLREEFPHLLVVPRADGWPSTLVLVATEALRRIEATQRAQRAEMQALAAQGHAALGRYMLEMRPSISNALTSVMGNADLLLDPGFTPEAREQLETIRTMSFRLNEIMQRFSSLAAELRAGEKESQGETQAGPYSLVSQP